MDRFNRRTYCQVVVAVVVVLVVLVIGRTRFPCEGAKHWVYERIGEILQDGPLEVC